MRAEHVAQVLAHCTRARTTVLSAEDSGRKILRCILRLAAAAAAAGWRAAIPGSALLYTAERDISSATATLLFSSLLSAAAVVLWCWLATILAQRAHDGILFREFASLSANRYTNASWLLQGSLLLPGPTATPPFCKSTPGSRVLLRTQTAWSHYLTSPYHSCFCVRGILLPQL